MFWRVFSIFAVVLGLWLYPLDLDADEPQDLEHEKARARELQSEIDRTTEELRETLRDEKQVMIHLDLMDRHLHRTENGQEALKKKIQATHLAIGEAQSRIQALRGEIQRLKDPFFERLVAMYKTQKAGYPALILSAQHPNEAYKRYRNLMLIVRQDAHELQHARDKVFEWEKAEIQLASREDELISLQEAQQKEMREIRITRAEKQNLLARIRKRKDLQQGVLGELEAASAELNRLIRELEKSSDVKPGVAVSVGDSGFAHYKGRLPAPVKGTVKTTFGKQLHPLLRTYTLNNGIEIGATEGAEIQAVHPGVVIYADWVQGYGNVIIIDHGAGYYTLYGHASRLLKREGETIQKREVIGHIGDTGSLIGPSLYFEVRKGGKPVDPMEWINLPRMGAKSQ